MTDRSDLQTALSIAATVTSGCKLFGSEPGFAARGAGVALVVARTVTCQVACMLL